MTQLVLIGLTSLFAATVNGALGYGYSSITVPIALLMITSRVLNPALVVVEVVVNIYALFIARKSARKVWPHVAPIAFGILPGVAFGGWALASISADWAKLVTYITLLPLILVQAAGLRWIVKNPRRTGAAFGAGVGILYSMTTISGPPLAMYFNNSGMDKNEFKVALALSRTIESTSTLLVYCVLGVITRDSLNLVPWLAPGVLIGLPIGFALIRKLDPNVFRRFCMSFDGWLVAFGLARQICKLDLATPVWAYQVLTATVIVDAILLQRFFARRAAGRGPTARAGPDLGQPPAVASGLIGR